MDFDKMNGKPPMGKPPFGGKPPMGAPGFKFSGGKPPADAMPPLVDVSFVKRSFLDVKYGDESPAQTMDIFLPDEGEGPFPLFIHIHGGGFAGTIQAFVPLDMLDDFCEKMEAVFSKGSCYVLSVRPFGGIQLF